MNVILGSSSIFRRTVMDETGISYKILSPGIDEKAVRDTDPSQLVLKISHAKADALEKRVTEPVYVITADQVVTHNGRILEKPGDIEEAKQNMRDFGDGKPVCTVSGIVVLNTETRQRAAGVDVVSIYFREFPEHVIEELGNREYALYVAGGIQIEDVLTQEYILKIDGTLDSVMGLPKKLLLNLLTQLGFKQ